MMISLAFFFSCSKEKQMVNACDTSTQYLSTDITQFKFKENSYWVFIDSISLTIDSMYVDTVLYYGMYPFKTTCPTKTYEGYGFSVRSSLDPSKQDVYRLKGGAVDRNPALLSDVNSSVYLDYDFGTLQPGSNNTLVKKDSVFIYDRYYKKVVIITKPTDNTELKKTVYYTNSEFGFLKKEIYSSANVLLSKKVLKNKNVIR